ncbi:unnamed protein product [Rotaria sordida]|uniref:Synaptogyrin n=1 Tax=Rotaria sordida TaxID=392033 RepID=A0A813VMS1_9BILA|nr:unnamed protein product [Rotaria sordida]CAF0839766.1 unnamed protein product [Rotaria sordida]CAF0875416.1 unnamed protein product [Rotaria sordida]CAF3472479.1 unnamed protein product [Rotaria sordida]CAF3561673.1 unnamed protein product [Rotaria sordida]
MNPSMEPQAFGAGRAGSTFDPIEFIKRPQVILRIVSWVFAIIVFACIAQEGYMTGECRYNGSGACGYGIAIGIIAFLFAMLFMGLDIFFPNISNITQRKIIVLTELVVSGILTFLWFVGFCYMADQWRQEPKKDTPGWNGRNNVQAAIAFAFFSIFSWGGLIFFTFRRYRAGVSNLFSSSYEDHSAGTGQTYGGYPPAGGTGSFSQPPFTATQQAQSNYQPPAY